MRRLIGPRISAVKWIDIRFRITGQWVSLFYLPEKQPFQALFYEHVPCQPGACGHFHGFVNNAKSRDLLHEFMQPVAK